MIELQPIKPKHSDGSKNPFKDGKEEFPVDTELDEIEVLGRYDSILRALVLRGYFKLYEREITWNDVGKTIQNSLLDRCVCHAIEGTDYISSIQMNVQYTVLQAALILTITANLYINPPVSFDLQSQNDAFSSLCGLAAFTHLFCIVSCTIVSGVLNMAYTAVDKMIAYHNTRATIGWTFTANYIAVVATVFAMLIAGYDRSSADIAVQVFALLVVVILIALFGWNFSIAANLQDQRALRFYQKYCDISGELKDEYLAAIQQNKAAEK